MKNKLLIITTIFLFLQTLTYAQVFETVQKRKGIIVKHNSHRISKNRFQDVRYMGAEDSVIWVKHQNRYKLLSYKGIFVEGNDYLYVTDHRNNFTLVVKKNSDTIKYGNQLYVYGLYSNNGLFANQMFSSIGFINDTTFWVSLNDSLYFANSDGNLVFRGLDSELKDTSSIGDFHQAEFLGGDDERIKFLSREVNYPQIAKELGIQGVVRVLFVIHKSGKVICHQVIDGPDDLLNLEVLRVIYIMPDFKPATVDGKPVSAYYEMSMKFELNY